MRTAESLSSSTDDGSLKVQAQEKVAEVGEQAKHMAASATQQATGIVRSKLDQTSTELATKVKEQTETIRTISSQLRQDGKQSQAQMLDRVGEQIEKVGDYLERADADTIISDVENLARRQPWIVAATAFGIGLIGSRLIKVSSEQRASAHGTMESPAVMGSEGLRSSMDPDDTGSSRAW